MPYRQSIWSLSNGVGALAISGAFWFGMAAWPTRLPVFFSLLVMIGLCLAAIVYAAVKLRRKSQGFKYSELKQADERQRRENQKLFRRFHLVNGGHIILILLSTALCFHFGRRELVWPFMALIVSLHFIPFAWLFRVRTYYATAIAGSCVSLAAILGFGESGRFVYLGLGMGTVIWLSAIYIAWNADAIARQTVAEENT